MRWKVEAGGTLSDKEAALAIPGCALELCTWCPLTNGEKLDKPIGSDAGGPRGGL